MNIFSEYLDTPHCLPSDQKWALAHNLTLKTIAAVIWSNSLITFRTVNERVPSNPCVGWGSIWAWGVQPHLRAEEIEHSRCSMTTLYQLPSMQSRRAKYFVMFEEHVAHGTLLHLHWGWVPLWWEDFWREQSHLEIRMCHLPILVSPIRFSLTNLFSRIFAASNYERATNCLYIQKDGSSSASLYCSSVCALYFLLPGRLETTKKNAYRSTKFHKSPHRYQ